MDESCTKSGLILHSLADSKELMLASMHGDDVVFSSMHGSKQSAIALLLEGVASQPSVVSGKLNVTIQRKEHIRDMAMFLIRIMKCMVADLKKVFR